MSKHDVKAARAVEPQVDSTDNDSGAEGASPSRAKGPASKKRAYASYLADNTDEVVLRAALKRATHQRSSERKQALAKLTQQASQWHLLLRSGSSVLLHGLGSKRHVLEHVAQNTLTDGAVVVCHGWAKGVSAHKILLAVLSALLSRSHKNVTNAEILSLIQAEYDKHPSRRVYLVLHSIDGPELRSESEQQALAELAACPNCHVIASCDNVQAALLWNSTTAALFRWLWVPAHTYNTLTAETLDMAFPMLGSKSATRARNATTILRSMVGSARDALALIVEAQIEDPAFEGVDFKHLFRMCRERFLYTSEAALRSALTEFTDHELLATRQSAEGGELLYVPLDAASLSALAQELEALQKEPAAA